MKNTIIGVVILGAVLGALAFFNLTPFRSAVMNALGSSAGSTYNTAKMAAVVVNLASPGANATSSSITNGDAGSRYVTGYRWGCTGVGTSQTAYTGTGLASLQLSIGTTSASAPATFSSNIPLISADVVATSTANNSFASSTTKVGNASLWRSGEIMTFSFNATNTAACTVGVDYIGS